MVAALPFSVVKTSGNKGQASARRLSFLAGYVVCPVLMLEEVGSPHPLTLSPPHHFITSSPHHSTFPSQGEPGWYSGRVVAKWQGEKWPGVISCSGGSWAHFSAANGHRERNTQPPRPSAWLPPAAGASGAVVRRLGSGTGMAASSVRV